MKWGILAQILAWLSVSLELDGRSKQSQCLFINHRDFSLFSSSSCFLFFSCSFPAGSRSYSLSCIPFYRVNTSDICLISGWSAISHSIKHKQPLKYLYTQRFLAWSADLSECIYDFTLDYNYYILKQVKDTLSLLFFFFGGGVNDTKNPSKVIQNTVYLYIFIYHRPPNMTIPWQQVTPFLKYKGSCV